MTHPSQVGSTSPWTVLAAMLLGPRSQPICRQTTTRLWVVLTAIQGAVALSSCPLSAHANRCAISLLGCLSRQTALDTSSSHPRTALHDQVTLQCSNTMFMPRLNMWRRDNRTSVFVIFVTEGDISTNSIFKSHFGCPTCELDLGVPFSKMAQRNNRNPLFFSDLKRRSNEVPIGFGVEVGKRCGQK